MSLNEYTEYQQNIIDDCNKIGMDTSSFTPEINPLNMRLVFLAFRKGLDITPYMKDFNYDQLDEIRLGLITGVDVSKYVDPKILADDMHMKRISLEDLERLTFAWGFLRGIPLSTSGYKIRLEFVR